MLQNSNFVLHDTFQRKLRDIGFTAERTVRLASKDVAIYLNSEESATKLLLHSQDWLAVRDRGRRLTLTV
jgi:myosin-crossreactive antigen